MMPPISQEDISLTAEYKTGNNARERRLLVQESEKMFQMLSKQKKARIIINLR
jgi:hypothetical protein